MIHELEPPGSNVLAIDCPFPLGLHGRERSPGPIGRETRVYQKPHVYVVQFSTGIVRAHWPWCLDIIL